MPASGEEPTTRRRRSRRRGPWRQLSFPRRYVATRFADALARHEITRIKIPARSPNHNAIVERFQGTMRQECWRPAFHRRHFTSIRQLQREADAWLITYNTRRRNHGNYMAGRHPAELLNKAS